jgi:hypothetical protein
MDMIIDHYKFPDLDVEVDDVAFKQRKLNVEPISRAQNQTKNRVKTQINH